MPHITSVLGAPGSGKSTVAVALAELLPQHAVLDWDAFMGPAAALAGREIRTSPATWPAYRDLVGTIIKSLTRLPVVLLGVCTPDELQGWPIDAWVLLDWTDAERRGRLGGDADRESVRQAIEDARHYRELGLPAIDTTGRAPEDVAAQLAKLVPASAAPRTGPAQTG